MSMGRPAKSILAALATSIFCASAVAEYIIDVSVLPTCAIAPEDRVTLEVFVGTNNSPGFLYQPSEVSVNQDQVFVDIYVDSCCDLATDIMLATVDLGAFDPGTYEYTLTLHRGTNVETAVGSFSVEPEPCLPAGAQVAQVYWTDSESRVIKRVDQDGFKVENLAVAGLCDIPADINGFTIDEATSKMYWGNRGTRTIDRANLDGSNVEHLVADIPQGPGDLALDAEANWMYWSEQSDMGFAKVRRARLDGTGAGDVVDGGLYRSKGLALDPVDGKLYIGEWRNSGRLRILRVNVDGSNLQTLAIRYPYRASDITVDFDVGKIFWIESPSYNESDGTMWRMDIDGTDRTSHVPYADCCPNKIVLDHDARRMYWGGWHVIQRAMLNVDGVPPEDLFDIGWSQIALDVVGGKMYFTTRGWSDWGLSGEVRRANLDGSAAETLATGLGYPDSIVLVAGENASQSIPTVSLWGVATLALLITTASCVQVRRACSAGVSPAGKGTRLP